MTPSIPLASRPRDTLVFVRSIAPGRVRLRVPALRDAPLVATRLEDRIAASAAVRSVIVNPLTTGVLIVFDPAGTTARRLVAAVRRYVAEGGPVGRARPQAPRQWHAEPAAQVLAALGSSPE